MAQIVMEIDDEIVRMTPHPIVAIFSAATMVLRDKHGFTREDLHRAIDAYFDGPEPQAGPKLTIIPGGKAD